MQDRNPAAQHPRRPGSGQKLVGSAMMNTIMIPAIGSTMRHGSRPSTRRKAVARLTPKITRAVTGALRNPVIDEG